MKNILEYLEDNALRYPQKVIFADDKNEITYSKFINTAKKIATKLIELGVVKSNVAVYTDKNINCLVAMFGTVYSSNCYCVQDVASPLDRISKINNSLNPQVIITDNKNVDKLAGLDTRAVIINIDTDINDDVDEEKISALMKRVIDTDPVYVLFTSGSTGVPKGTIVCHRSIISYILSVNKTFNLNQDVVYGSQTPFYFSMSVLDVFSTVILGATLVIIPKVLFSFPVKLIEYMNERRINTIYWVPTALCIVANRNTFKVCLPQYLEKIMFAGEVMPTKQLNYWISYMPDKMYANLFGPTEVTDTCTYYIVDRNFLDSETLPIGIPFENCDVLLLDENENEVVYGEQGELCVRGTFLALGYYNNEEKTNQVFVQNPLNKMYPELIYRTGDIVKYNDKGELIYLGRKDFQIKHMGYRIELGEIEATINGIEGISTSVALYDKVNSKIVLFFEGKLTEDEIEVMAAQNLLHYMRPGRYIKLKHMPINANGKLDRILLKSMI